MSVEELSLTMSEPVCEAEQSATYEIVLKVPRKRQASLWTLLRRNQFLICVREWDCILEVRNTQGRTGGGRAGKIISPGTIFQTVIEQVHLHRQLINCVIDNITTLLLRLPLYSLHETISYRQWS